MLSVSSSPQRLSAGTRFARQSTPYVNISSPILPHGHPQPPLPHGHPRAPITYERIRTWRGQPGYGRRHMNDDAPFSLWNEATRDFRYPTRDELNWLANKFPASTIDIGFPELVVHTASPPDPVPLTIAGLAVTFTAQLASGSNIGAGFDPRPIKTTTPYVGPRVADPMNLRLRRWVYPSEDEIKAVVEAVMSCCNARTINFLCPYIIVEIHCDGRSYQPMSLPAKFGGYLAIYHHQHLDVFENMVDSARSRLITPQGNVGDTGDYLQEWHQLCPGVRLESSTVTGYGRYATMSSATSAGVLVRDNAGNQRLTVANHGFKENDEVYHPNNAGTRIGDIDERWLLQDIALVKLNPSINFTNTINFEAKIPRRLLRYSEITQGAWYCVDGMSTGAVWMHSIGVRVLLAPRPSVLGPIEYEYSRYIINRTHGPSGAAVRDGLCGAPIVEDDEDTGGVAGFFQLASDDYVMSPILDEFIDRSWNIV